MHDANLLVCHNLLVIYSFTSFLNTHPTIYLLIFFWRGRKWGEREREGGQEREREINMREILTQTEPTT